ncbi:MAG TPA: 4Fe-4S binding protein [Dehalococcoidia bacterium]|nr:4Fe-4S binding protein [Dehalococcoidia bacterium]
MRFERYGVGVAKGMVVTFKHLFRHPITVQYPEERLVVSRRIRGNELVWFPDRCTGCATCAKSCPQGNIEIVTHIGDEDKYVVDKFEVDTGRCMFCGLCVESCPYEALAMGISYERAQYRRRQLVLSKEELQLSDIRRPSGYARPKIEPTLPRQSLLVDWDREEGGQKLSRLPLSKKRGRGV